MKTIRLTVTAEEPDAAAIERAAAVLRAGGLVAFPTETVYGLGANALNEAAVASVFAAKGRPPVNPLIVHIADPQQALEVAADWPEQAARLSDRFWPGPLTLVLPRHASLPQTVTAGGATVAVRTPAHPIARALILAAAIPIAAPSANRSSRISPTTAQHVLKSLDGRIDLVLDAGATPGGVESTVLDLTERPFSVLRPGPILRSDIEAMVGPIRYGGDLRPGEQLRSPGLLSRHYAPNAGVELVDDGAGRVRACLQSQMRVGWITMEDVSEELPGLIVVKMPPDHAGYAAALYGALHALDDAMVERIVVDSPPQSEEWDAVNDRLRRAST